MTTAPASNGGNGTSVAAPSDSTPNTSTDTATTRITDNPAPARNATNQPATTAPTTDSSATTTPVSSAPTPASPVVTAPDSTLTADSPAASSPVVPAGTDGPAPGAGTPSAPNPGTPATEAPAAPSAEAPAQVPGGYPVVTPEQSPQVGLDSNGKYAPGLKMATMDQGRLFFAYSEHWDVFATSDTSMSISTKNGYVEGGIDIRQAGAPAPEMPEMTHTRTLYGQAQGPDHAANVVAGRTDGPFNTDRLSWRLHDPSTGGSGLSLPDGRTVDVQLYSIIGEGQPQLTGAEIEMVMDSAPQNPDYLAAQNILGTIHYVG